MSKDHPFAPVQRVGALFHRAIVGRLVRRVRKPAGSVPGTLVHTGERKVEEIRIRFLDYDAATLRERTVERIEECFPPAAAPTVTWVNVDGLHDPEVFEALERQFGFHRLLLEDVMSPGQRAKVEDYGDYVFVVLNMLSFDRESKTLMAEQVSLIVGGSYVFSFQERYGDVFEPVRERIRNAKGRIRAWGPDYLAYALIDAVVDSYFGVLESIGEVVEELEELALSDPSPEVRREIHRFKRESLILRRAVWPLRDALGTITRGDVGMVKDETLVFFNDVHDHAVQVMDTVETLREVISGSMELYLSGVSNRMNEVMKVLTIISTIFIPLSFIVGLYGMNFEHMPELSIRWAYPALLVFMATAVGMMLLYFKRRGWL